VCSADDESYQSRSQFTAKRWSMAAWSVCEVHDTTGFPVLDISDE